MVERSSSYPETRKSRYTLDHQFLDSINSEEKAYWLGFVTADGSVHIGDDGKRRLSVQLAAYDGGHLQKMADAFASNKPVLYTKRNEAVLVFNSLPIVRSLSKLGVNPRKSGIVLPWSGPVHLMPHYWRGLLDGDGTISLNRAESKWTVGICGSVHCVVEFSNWARDVSLSKAVPRQAPGSSLCWYWQVAGTWAPQRLVSALYRNANIFLDRKKNLADRLMAIEFQNPSKTKKGGGA
jgi:hypothetical protein